jgi:hypothetical protein
MNPEGLSAMLSVSLRRRFFYWLLASFTLPAALTAQVSLLSTPFSPVGNGPRNVAVADLNGDGKADLVAVNSSDNTISVVLSNGDGTFRPAVTYAVGPQPNDVVIADFNGDGKPDLAVTSQDAKEVSVLLGNGDGTFQAAVNYPTSDMTLDLVVADFNGDGKLDIAATDFFGGVSILLGNGDGTFQADRPFSTGTSNLGVDGALAVADFNGDGKPDLAVVNNNDDSVTIFLGNGDGTFTQGAAYNFTSAIERVAVGDLNLDGKPDLVITPGNSGYPLGAVMVLVGNGDGTFAAPVNYGTALSSAIGVVVADFNGDGKPDIAVTDQLTNIVLLLTGQGDGTFQTSFLYAVGSGPEGIAVGDFNGDGKIDLATANIFSNDVSTLLGNGDGTFRGARSYQGSGSLLVLDLNHDGKLDVVASTGVMLGNGDGTLQPRVIIPLNGPDSGPPVTADFNRDGNPDLAFPTSLNLATGDQAVAVLLGNGDGTFQPEKDLGVNFLGPQYLVTTDFNGDGNPDLIVTGDGIAIGLGDGTGNFQFQFIMNAPDCCQIVTADFNRDGKPDFIVLEPGGGLFLSLGNGDGTFQPSVMLNNAPGGHALTGLLAADVNGDGIPDLVVVNNAVGGPLSVMLGNGDGTFANPVSYAVGDFPTSVAMGDLNHDGHADLVVALISGRVVVLLGNGDGTFQPAINFGSGFPPGFAGGGLVGVAVADLNGDGYPDVLVANSSGLGTVTVLLNQTNSSPPAASTVGLSSSLNPAASGQAVTLTATAAPANGGTAVPTGTVTFLDGSTSLGKATLSGGMAALTVSTLSVGNRNLTAAYSGDTHFYGNASAPLVEVVNANAFTVTASGTGSASITPGQKAQYQLMLVSGTAQSQQVSLSCSGVPPLSTCVASPNPATLSATSTTNVTVTVQTTGPNSALTFPIPPNRSRPIFLAAGWQPAALAILFSGLLLTGTTPKPRRAALGLLLLLLIGLAACSSGNSSTTTQGTPPASYTIVVTAQSSAGTQQIRLALTVNP